MYIFLILILILTYSIIITLTIKIEIKEKELTSYEKIKKIKYKVSIFLLNKIKLFSFKILPKRNNFNKYKIMMKDLIDIFKKIKLEKLFVNLKVGTENPIATSHIVLITSTLMSVLLQKKSENYSKSNYKYQIVPLYVNKNVFNLSINCILSIKLIHIIDMIYVLKRKDEERNGRTSNRRTYDNCYEQHKRYGRCRYNYR